MVGSFFGIIVCSICVAQSVVASEPHLIPSGEVPRLLCKAVSDGNMEDVKTLLDGKAPANCTCPGDGYTPLQNAALKGKGGEDFVQLLLAHGADPSMTDEHERPRAKPLAIAAFKENLTVCKMLVKAKAFFDVAPLIGDRKDILHSVRDTEKKYGDQLLSKAFFDGAEEHPDPREETVEKLIENGSIMMDDETREHAARYNNIKNVRAYFEQLYAQHDVTNQQRDVSVILGGGKQQ